MEQDVQPGSAARVPIYSRSVNLQEAMGTYAVAARNDGFLYVTAQNKNMIYLFDPADIRAGDTGFAPYLVALGFEKSPQSIAFVGDRLFVTLRVMINGRSYGRSALRTENYCRILQIRWSIPRK